MNDVSINPKLTRRTRRRAKHRVENETKIETFLGFGEVLLHSEKHPHEGEAQGQVSTKTSPVQDGALRGHGNFEWNTDLIEKKLENYTRQVAQGLYSLHETLRTQSLARKFGARMVDGTNGGD